MRVTIVGIDPPGAHFETADARYDNVHVGIQQRRDVEQQVRADATDIRFECDVEVIDKTDGDERGAIDFRGPYVQGPRGHRFLYLSWGAVGLHGFAMFRRAKLMLDRIPEPILTAARRTDALSATVNLTGGDGGPVCAAVKPGAITWSAGER